MIGERDAGKGDETRVRNIRLYSQRNDEINWPHRKAKRDMEARARLDARLKGPKCPESEFKKHERI